MIEAIPRWSRVAIAERSIGGAGGRSNEPPLSPGDRKAFFVVRVLLGSSTRGATTQATFQMRVTRYILSVNVSTERLHAGGGAGKQFQYDALIEGEYCAVVWKKMLIQEAR
jgi:hypothetical protein